MKFVSDTNISKIVAAVFNRLFSIDNKKVDKSVVGNAVSALSVSVDAQQTNAVAISVTTIDTSTGSLTATSNLLPIASEDSGGLMPKEAFQTLVSMQSSLAAIDGVVTYLNGKNFETGDIEELQSLFTAEAVDQGFTEPLPNSLIINNWFNGVEYIYNSANNRWIEYGVTTAALATNTTAGLWKGDNSDGKGFAETDGTISVVGWDSLKARVAALETKIAAELDGLDEVVTDIEAML
jgi:hypothetical protein